jgi:two-component system chemotaxis response regulator CheB
MIKTLIVDDSPLARSIIRNFLEHDLSFEITGEAENGKDSIKKVKELAPDLVTMDIDMPVMNGLDAILEIRKISSCGIVVITTNDSAKIAYYATVNGAHEYFSKDIFTSQMSEQKHQEIINTLKQITHIKENHTDRKISNNHVISPREIKCIVIAASTGGPLALCQLFADLPQTFPVPILLVQHNTSGFDKSFVEWLNEYSYLKIQLAQEGTIPVKGNIYVAPTEKHLLVNNDKLVFDDSKPVFNQKPAADMLFKSAAAAFGDSIISVVLTGMGEDGADGTRSVKNTGGITIAQDESSSMIFGMPKAAIETGCVDMALPLNKIAEKLVSLTNGEYQR